MDVTCTRCGTVYEFEEALISTTGTTVKCTHCGHLFKVHRPAPSSEQQADAEAPRELRWRVRRTDGSTHMLESLAELTRLIAAGQFTRDDEISRTGQVWKRLGDIQELASLFESAPHARSRRTSESLSLPPPIAVASPPPPPAASPLPAEPPAGPPVAVGAEPAALPPAALPQERPAPEPFEVRGGDAAFEEPTEPTLPRPEAPVVVPTGAPPSRPEPPRVRPAPSAPSEPAIAPLEPEPDFRPASSRLWLWLAIGLPLAAAAGIAGAYVMRPRPQVVPEPNTRTYLLRADEALASHLPERFDEAVAEYTKALAFHPDDAHILSSISRIYAIWSQLTFVRHALAVADGEGAAAADALQAEARRLADQAKLYGQRAAQRNPGNEEASVALSDALRLTGNLVAARAELDRARATEGVPSAETLRVAALLAIDEAHGDLSAGRSFAEQAVARDPDLIRTRVLLARCLAHEGDFDGARMHLAAVRRSNAPHSVLDELQAAIDREEQRRKAPRPAKPAQPPTAAVQQPRPEPAKAEPADEAKAEPTSKAEPASAPPPVRASAADAAELAQRGEAALEQGQVQAAEQFFQQALAAQPGMPRARTGLGYVALERSQPRLALQHFRPAARAGHAEALIGLGDAYRRLGRLSDALEAYEEYLRKHPRGERRSIAQRQVELLTEQLAE